MLIDLKKGKKPVRVNLEPIRKVVTYCNFYNMQNRNRYFDIIDLL